jgi:hypothetical protein
VSAPDLREWPKGWIISATPVGFEAVSRLYECGDVGGGEAGPPHAGGSVHFIASSREELLDRVLDFEAEVAAARLRGWADEALETLEMLESWLWLRLDAGLPTTSSMADMHSLVRRVVDSAPSELE